MRWWDARAADPDQEAAATLGGGLGSKTVAAHVVCLGLGTEPDAEEASDAVGTVLAARPRHVP